MVNLRRQFQKHVLKRAMPLYRQLPRESRQAIAATYNTGRNIASVAYRDIVPKSVRRYANQTYKTGRYLAKKIAPATGSRSGSLKTYEAPASMAVAAGGVTPTVSMKGETKIVSGQELVVSSVTSAITGDPWQINPRIDVNPLNPLLPILASEAQSYQMYRFTKLEAHYENLCPSSTQGQLFMGVLADPADPLPESAQEATAIKNSVRNAMWVPSKFSFPCDGQFRYVDGTIATDADQRNLNQFSFWYGTLGFGPTTTSAGTIRLNYTIELQKRIAPFPLASINVKEIAGASGAAILPGIQSFVGPRRGRWYTIDLVNQRLVHRAAGKFTISFMIRSTADVNVFTPLSTMAFATYTGAAVTPVDEFIAFGFSNTAHVNRSVGIRVCTYKFSDAGGTIDLSWLAALTNIDLSFSVDRL